MSISSTQANPLLGTWKLISASAIHADGTVIPEIYGEDPIGYITYTTDGHMMVMFSRSNRPPLSKPVQSPFRELEDIPNEELARAFTSFNAYAGTYTLNDNTVSHYLVIASIPNRVNTTLVRTFTIDNNRLTLRTPEIISDGIAKAFELIWQQI